MFSRLLIMMGLYSVVDFITSQGIIDRGFAHLCNTIKLLSISRFVSFFVVVRKRIKGLMFFHKLPDKQCDKKPRASVPGNDNVMLR